MAYDPKQLLENIFNDALRDDETREAYMLEVDSLIKEFYTEKVLPFIISHKGTIHHLFLFFMAELETMFRQYVMANSILMERDTSDPEVYTEAGKDFLILLTEAAIQLHENRPKEKP